MKTLIIAEKPSVARDIASALGNVKKNGDWFEDDQYIISSAIGHLVELFMPEDIDKKLTFWKLQDLPIIPDKFCLKPIDRTKKKFAELKKLLSRKDVEKIVNACDSGREGELIFTNIYELAKCRKPVLRLWLSSMLPQAIRVAFSHLRSEKEMLPLQDAARCRSESDWLIGINGTRAITRRMYKSGSKSRQVATVGRVQTPTLALVLEREKQIISFQPLPYWRILGKFGVKQGEYEGVYHKPDFKKSSEKTSANDRIDRLWERTEAETIMARINEASNAEVTDEKKRTRQLPPRLYDLTSLQREANSRFSLPARKTLQIAQELYEKHKLITYPRTDSRALPEDYIQTCKNTLDSLGGDLQEFARKVLDSEGVRPNKRVFNNAQVSDHFAIIPTGRESRNLDFNATKILDMIARRFVAVFFPEAVFDVTTRLSAVEDAQFKTEGKVLINPGWLEVYGKSTDGSVELPALSPQDGSPAQAQVLNFELAEDTTKPPPRYTDATLLSAMENAGKLVEDEELAEAMKGKGLGTPATRAQTIEHLIKENYMERHKRDLSPTAKADSLIEFLDALKVGVLTSPALTGEWEHKLSLIEEGKLSRKEFMQGISDMTSEIVQKTKDFEESDVEERITNIISPTDGKPIKEGLRQYKSQDGTISIYKVICNRKFSEEEIGTIIKNREIGPLDGFISKSGKPFSATLRLNDSNKIEFVFDQSRRDNSMDGIDPDKLPVLGKCPKDGAKLLDAPNAFICENAIGENKTCDFRVSRTMLSRSIPNEQFLKLIENGKTDLLEKFRSKKTGKLFSAFLILKKNGSIGFEFPAREKKIKSTPKSKKRD